MPRQPDTWALPRPWAVPGRDSTGSSAGGTSRSGVETVTYVLRRKVKAPLKTYNVGSPMERIAIDVLGPLPMTEAGNKYILVIADYFTK